MRRLVLLALAGALVAPASAAAAPVAPVDRLVVGRTEVLRDARAVTPKAVRAKVGSRRCAVGARTPLAALLRTPLELGLRDYGACGRRPRDAASLFVRSVRGERNRGQDGWVYKVDGKVPSLGAADPAVRLKRGQDLLWFWCDMGVKGCQRTLSVDVGSAMAVAGQSLTVAVRGADDRGRTVPVAGATVTAAGVSALSGPDGNATLAVPAGSASLDLVATRAGMVRSFPATVAVR